MTTRPRRRRSGLLAANAARHWHRIDGSPLPLVMAASTGGEVTHPLDRAGRFYQMPGIDPISVARVGVATLTGGQ